MNFYEFEKLFKEKEKEININIPDENVEKFYKYMKSLIEWNEKINLTAITDEEEIIAKHFIDSLTILKYIKDDYTTAIQIYESLLKNGESADVYYNLGNSYYKLEK